MNDERKSWPQTVAEAVEYLVSVLSEDDKSAIKAKTKAGLIDFHFGLGADIRNRLGFYQGNQALLDSCADRVGWPENVRFIFRADNASGVILESLWERLQSE